MSKFNQNYANSIKNMILSGSEKVSEFKKNQNTIGFSKAVVKKGLSNRVSTIFRQLQTTIFQPWPFPPQTQEKLRQKEPHRHTVPTRELFAFFGDSHVPSVDTVYR